MKIKKLKEELKFYLEELEDLEISKTTIKNYKNSIKLFIKYLITNKVKTIDNNNINAILKKYRSYLKTERNNKTPTRIRYLKDIVLFLEKINFKINIELPKDPSKNEKIKYLTMEEIKEVMKSIPKDMTRDKAIFQMLYRTGLRVSELTNLTQQDLNLKSTDQAIAVYVKNGKGGKDRTVYIDQPTLKLLNKMIYKRTRKGKKDKNNYLFTARTGNPLKPRSVQWMIKKYAITTDQRLAKEGIKTNFKDKLTPHTLRHSFTIYLLNEAEKPINEVQKLLGHSNLATTSIYAQVDNKTIKKSYETIQWDKQ